MRKTAKRKSASNMDYKMTHEETIEGERKNIEIFYMDATPKDHTSFSFLQNCVLEKVKGNYLGVRKGNLSVGLYLHEGFDRLYLSEQRTNFDDIVQDMNRNSQGNPLSREIGRKITKVEQEYTDAEDQRRDLPREVVLRFGSVAYGIAGDDRMLFIGRIRA